MNKILAMTFVAMLSAIFAVYSAERNEKTVFITSENFNGNLGGLKGADDKCQAEADGPESIVPSGIYKAWLSDGTDSPNTRFKKSSHPYVLPDGAKIANNYSDLTDESILHAINIDPTGNNIGVNLFWTGTNSDGTSAPQTRTCNAWANLYANVRGMVGSTGQVSSLWSSYRERRCKNILNKLACFQQ